MMKRKREKDPKMNRAIMDMCKAFDLTYDEVRSILEMGYIDGTIYSMEVKQCKKEVLKT